MNNKILVTIVLFLIISVATARQCYKCVACPKPFQGNEAGVDKVDVGDNDFCQKVVLPITGLINRDTAGGSCTPVNNEKFCCQGNLCNGATTATLNVKLLAAMASLFFIVRLFH